MKYLREHKWDKNDTIITLYYHKYGTRHLPVKSDVELAENIIGSSLDSLKMQAENVKFILTKRGLDSPSKIQKEVVEEYHQMDESDLRNEVIDIINDTDRQVIVSERIKILQEKAKIEKAKEEKKRLDVIFRKMGKNPSKMKFVGSRPKEQE